MDFGSNLRCHVPRKLESRNKTDLTRYGNLPGHAVDANRFSMIKMDLSRIWRGHVGIEPTVDLTAHHWI